MKNLIPKIVVPLLAIGLIAGGVQQASAATKSYSVTATLPSTKTDVNSTVYVAPFNPYWGTLQTVSIQLAVDVTTTITVTNTAAAAANGSVSTNVVYYLDDLSHSLLTKSSTYPSPENPNDPLSVNKNTVGLQTGVQYYSNLASGSTTLESRVASATSTNTNYTSGLILSEFSTWNPVALTLQTNTSTLLSNTGGNTSATQNTNTGATVTVTYTYEEVPEPSTWAMIVGGVGMLVVGQRLRRRSA